MNPKLSLSALLFSFILFSCNQKSKLTDTKDNSLEKIEITDPSPRESKNEKQKIPLGNLKQDDQDSVATQSQPQLAAHIDWDKRIIKTATVKLEIKDFKKYNDAVHKTVRQFGGYIAQEEQHLTDERSETVLSIKVPVDQFEPMINQLPGDDAKVTERTITSQDVTGEMVDIKSRVEAKKQVRLKYIDFLKSSKNMEDVLKVQSEINGLQEEIEAAAGRVEYLSHQSAFSTINLTFYQPVVGFKPIDTTPSFFSRVTSAFKTGADWIGDFFVALISVWPLFLITISGILVFKRMKSFKTNPQNP